MHLEDIEATILVGGCGSRLRSVVADRPKVLASVKGRPFIYFLLDQFYDVGIKKILLCTGYKAQNVEETVGYKYRSLDIRYSRESKPLGTGGALALAGNMLNSEWIIVSNGDSFIDIDYVKYMSWHHNKAALISVVVTSVDDASRYGSVVITPDGEITKFLEKPKSSVGQTRLINAGVYLMHKSAIDSMPKGKKYSLENEFLPSKVENGLYGFKVNGAFIDIGIPESYRMATSFFDSV